jgi:hypothetical protein
LEYPFTCPGNAYYWTGFSTLQMLVEHTWLKVGYYLHWTGFSTLQMLVEHTWLKVGYYLLLDRVFRTSDGGGAHLDQGGLSTTGQSFPHFRRWWSTPGSR